LAEGNRTDDEFSEAVVMIRGPRTKEWVVYVLGGKRAQRLGTIAAPDRDAAIAKAIDLFGTTSPERQRRVIVRPIKSLS
jgi:hypothetical protein